MIWWKVTFTPITLNIIQWQWSVGRSCRASHLKVCHRMCRGCWNRLGVLVTSNQNWTFRLSCKCICVRKPTFSLESFGDNYVLEWFSQNPDLNQINILWQDVSSRLSLTCFEKSVGQTTDPNPKSFSCNFNKRCIYKNIKWRGLKRYGW